MTELRLTVVNTSEAGGTALTPFWFGLHDGTFDLYDLGAAASAGLEQIAEDGSPAGLNAELTAIDADAVTGAVFGDRGPIAAGEQAETFVQVDGTSATYLDIAAMILPSNDAFVGTANSVLLFDDSGDFVGETVIAFDGGSVRDAGTEVNTEMDAAFINQTGPNTGIDEGGVITVHPGFNGSEGNPGGDQIILGGTNAFGEFIDPVAADFTRDGAEIATFRINEVNRVEFGRGRDVFEGGAEDDIVSGGRGKDKLYGGDGWDELSGGRGRDMLDGGAGADFLDGGRGRDILTTGEGPDAIFWADGDGFDVVTDFEANDMLLLDIAAYDTAEAVLAGATETARGVRLDFETGGILLEDVTLDDLSSDQFAFV